MTDKTKEEIDLEVKHLLEITNHIKNVQRNAIKLGFALIQKGKFDFAKQLMANAFIHDNSKFYGVEFQFLNRECKDGSRQLAIQNHIERNPHHPEYWTTIEDMPDVYLAEMVCDWIARSTEMGTDLRAFINETATEKYNFKLNSKIHKKIKYYVNLILEEPFK